jgi:hypothetical protein
MIAPNAPGWDAARESVDYVRPRRHAELHGIVRATEDINLFIRSDRRSRRRFRDRHPRSPSARRSRSMM